MLIAKEPMIFIEVPQDPEVMDQLPNITIVMTDLESTIVKGDQEGEEKIITDVWVGIVLTLLVMSCIVCMCSCIVYHRFQLWKRNVLRMRTDNNGASVENTSGDIESLPSYTIVSGLPSYDEALQQLQIVKQLMMQNGTIVVQTNSNATTPAPAPALARLSVSELMQLYKQPQLTLESKDSDKT